MVLIMNKLGPCLPCKNGLDYSGANLLPEAAGKLPGTCPPLVLGFLLHVWCQWGTVLKVMTVCTNSQFTLWEQWRRDAQWGPSEVPPFPPSLCVDPLCLSPSLSFLYYHVNNNNQAPHPSIRVSRLPSQLTCLPPYVLNGSIRNREVHAWDVGV